MTKDTPPSTWFYRKDDYEEEGAYTESFRRLAGKPMEVYQRGNEHLLKPQASSLGSRLLGEMGRDADFDINELIKAEQEVVSATEFTPARLEVQRVRTGGLPRGNLETDIFLEGIDVDEEGNPVAAGLQATMRGFVDPSGVTSALAREFYSSSPIETYVSVTAQPPHGGKFEVEVHKNNELLTTQSGVFGSTLDFKGKQPNLDKRLGLKGQQATNLLGDVVEIMTGS